MVNTLLGVFSPFKFELPEYLGYNVIELRDNLRILEVILNRGGSAGGIVGLFFDGAVCEFQELPQPNDPTIQKVYQYCRELRNKKKSKLLILISKTNGKLLHYFRKKRYWKVQFH